MINVAFPKFKYENEAQVVKQSLAGFIVMFSQLILSIGLLVLCEAFSFIGMGIVGIACVLLIFIIIAVTLYIIMTNVSVRKYERIQV